LVEVRDVGPTEAVEEAVAEAVFFSFFSFFSFF